MDDDDTPSLDTPSLDTPSLDFMLDQPVGSGGPAAGRDELQAIVARSGRRRTRIMAVGMAATLAVGGAAGWAAASSGSSDGTSVAVAHADSGTTVPALRSGVSASASGSGGGVSSALVAGGYPKGLTMAKKFVRTTADGVAIRGYQQATPPNLPPPLANCGLSFSGFQAEISTAAMAGIAGSGFGPQAPTGVFQFVQPTTLGLFEGAPVWVVTTRTASSVAQVRVTFADGKTDQMATVDGWAVLARVAPVPTSSVVTLPADPSGNAEALDGSGKVVGTESLQAALVTPKNVPYPPVAGGPAVVGPGPGPGGIHSSAAATSVAPPSFPTTTILAGRTVPSAKPAVACASPALDYAVPDMPVTGGSAGVGVPVPPVASTAPAPPPTGPAATTTAPTVP